MLRRFHLPVLAAFFLWSTMAFADYSNPSNDPNCGAPNVLLVVDTSGSMSQAGKIQELKKTIGDAIRLFKTKVRFGLIAFSNDKATYLVEVGPDDLKHADAHAQKLNAAAQALNPMGNTPMTQAMRLAVTVYRDKIIPPDPLHKDPDLKTKRHSYVLLITDGEPTDGDPRGPIKQLRALKVGPKTYDIKTFVVGMGSDQDIRAYTLEQYAKEGGTTHFFHALHPGDLQQMFKRIVTDVSRTTEICNGRDDDCDGIIDEDIHRECKSVCGVGTEICHKGKWSKCNAPEAQTEVCDGHDNDCDGQVDEELTRDCSNACGKGTQACINGDWSTCSAPRPQLEVCDGKDNDCDGEIDEDSAACPGGKCVTNAQGITECEIKSKNGECPAGFIADPKDGSRCKELPCRRHKCPPGQICINQPDFTAKCFDPCAGVTCPAGKTCGRKGVCVNCYLEKNACAPGMICSQGRCVVDKCLTANCKEGQGCRDGVCFTTCKGKTCKEGQRCQTLDPKYPRGVCAPDPCYGIKCGKGEACVDGKCVINKCTQPGAADCGQGKICDPVTGLCSENPCLRTHCPAGTKCVFGECIDAQGATPNTAGQCTVDADCDNPDYVCKSTYCVPKAAVQGGSCNCSIDSHSGNMTPFLFLFLIFFLGLLRPKRQ